MNGARVQTTVGTLRRTAALCCSVCGVETRHHMTGLYDDRYGYPDAFDVNTCPACGHTAVVHGFGPGDIGGIYTDYYPRAELVVDPWKAARTLSPRQSWWAGERAQPYMWVPGRVRVLDIGCGAGVALVQLKRKECDAVGCEADRNVAGMAEKAGLDVKIGVFDSADYSPASFDYVTMAQVIEHMIDPVDTLRQVAHILKAGGRVVISVPNAHSLQARLLGRRWVHWHIPYHLQHFSRRSLRVLAGRAGFTVERIANVTPSAWMAIQLQHLLTFPLQGEPAAFWTGRSVVRGWRWAAREVVSRLQRFGVFALLTRALDFLGTGDCLVVVLRKADVDRPAGS